jgi:hypothetical protein
MELDLDLGLDLDGICERSMGFLLLMGFSPFLLVYVFLVVPWAKGEC